MINLRKYRQISYLAVIAMTVMLLLSFAALWNSLLASDVKHEGWVVVFCLLSFASGLVLFFLAHQLSDASKLENIKRSAYEAGKGDILQEIEKRNHVERSDEKVAEEDIDKSVDSVFSGLKNVRTISGMCNRILSNLAKQMGIVQGVFYLKGTNDEQFEATGEYALTDRKPQSFRIGEGLPGQVAASKSMMVLYDVPEDYFKVSSGLGSSKPRFLLLTPVMFQDECIAVMELAAFKKPDETTGKILNKVASEAGIRINKLVVAR
jgi:hypothetical protein